MKIIFKKRNEAGLHCRFCKDYISNVNIINLYETSPIKGIVCECCKEHLKDYLRILGDKK